jgi:hypothetical protein
MQDSAQPEVKVPIGWAATEGHVLDKTLDTIDYTAGGERIIYYAPIVHYAYHVNGDRYESRRVTPQALRFNSRRMAESFLNAYSVGQPVTVIYNPADPRAAYLAKSAALMNFSRQTVYRVLGALVAVALVIVLLLLLL